MNYRFNALACCLSAVLLTGCMATKPSRYYTLMAPEATQQAGAVQAESASNYVISVSPVVLPEEVDRPQIVIADTTSTQVMPLGDSLWASPLAYQLQNALSYRLSNKLGVLDVSASGLPASLAAWRILLNVQRFESVYNERVLLDASWRLTPVNQGKKAEMLCRGVVQIPVGQGVSALVKGHREALGYLSDAMAYQIETGRFSVPDAKVNLSGCTFIK